MGSKEDFERLHEDLKAEFCPNGRAEEEAVLHLTFLIGTGKRFGSAFADALVILIGEFDDE